TPQGTPASSPPGHHAALMRGSRWRSEKPPTRPVSAWVTWTDLNEYISRVDGCLGATYQQVLRAPTIRSATRTRSSVAGYQRSLHRGVAPIHHSSRRRLRSLRFLKPASFSSSV